MPTTSRWCCWGSASARLAVQPVITSTTRTKWQCPFKSASSRISTKSDVHDSSNSTSPSSVSWAISSIPSSIHFHYNLSWTISHAEPFRASIKLYSFRRNITRGSGAPVWCLPNAFIQSSTDAYASWWRCSSSKWCSLLHIRYEHMFFLMLQAAPCFIQNFFGAHRLLPCVYLTKYCRLVTFRAFT